MSTQPLPPLCLLFLGLTPHLAAQYGQACSNPQASFTMSITDSIVITDPGRIGGLQVELDIRHTALNDLRIRLRQVSTGTQVTLLEYPSCLGEDVQCLVSDRFPLPIQTHCVGGIPAITGELYPKESMLIFYGTEIAGEWQLEVANPIMPFGGTLRRWCLRYELAEQVCLAPALPIPDASPAGVTDSLFRLGSGSAGRLGVRLYIAHPDVSSLRVTLTKPGTGISVTLLDAIGISACGTDVDCMLHDRAQVTAIPYACVASPAIPRERRPEQALAALSGVGVAGSWELNVVDTRVGGTGFLSGWCLYFLPDCGASCGDCDGSGPPPTILDALQAARITVGLSYFHDCCDVDADGDADIIDALLIAQVATGLPVALACQ